MDPQPVEVVDLSGPALDWFKLSVVVQLGVGVATLTILTAAVVVYFWRGRS